MLSSITDCQRSAVAGFKDALRVGLDEMLWAVQESFAGLTAEQLWALAAPEHHCIGVLVLHLQDNIDTHTNWHFVGQHTVGHDRSLCDLWQHQQVRDLSQAAGLPTTGELLARHQSVAQTARNRLESLSEPQLAGIELIASSDWVRHHRRIVAELFARVTHHSNAHVRQIWYLRGLRGWGGWPVQHYH